MSAVIITSKKDPQRILKLKNPVMNAAGCFSARDYSAFLDLNKLGAYVSKSITLESWPGNEPPRIREVDNGMINCIGLENKGLNIFLKTTLAFLKNFNLPFIVSIAGQTMEEYVELAKVLDKTSGVHAIEINISSPNLDMKGMEFGKDAQKTFEAVTRLRAATGLPLVTKLSPNVTDIVEIAQAAQNAGSDALCLINTVNAMAIDLKNKKPYLKSAIGGLSGPTIKPIALAMVWQVSRAVKIPVIGVGGIMNTNDGLEFLIAGASAIQVGTANFNNPRVMIEIIDGLEEYFKENRIEIFKKDISIPKF